jgi:hypothetical protein
VGHVVHVGSCGVDAGRQVELHVGQAAGAHADKVRHHLQPRGSTSASASPGLTTDIIMTVTSD